MIIVEYLSVVPKLDSINNAPTVKGFLTDYGKSITKIVFGDFKDPTGVSKCIVDTLSGDLSTNELKILINQEYHKYHREKLNYCGEIMRGHWSVLTKEAEKLDPYKKTFVLRAISRLYFVWVELLDR